MDPSSWYHFNLAFIYVLWKGVPLDTVHPQELWPNADKIDLPCRSILEDVLYYLIITHDLHQQITNDSNVQYNFIPKVHLVVIPVLYVSHDHHHQQMSSQFVNIKEKLVSRLKICHSAEHTIDRKHIATGYSVEGFACILRWLYIIWRCSITPLFTIALLSPVLHSWAVYCACQNTKFEPRRQWSCKLPSSPQYLYY